MNACFIEDWKYNYLLSFCSFTCYKIYVRFLNFFFLLKTCHEGLVNHSVWLFCDIHVESEEALKFVFGDWKFSYCKGKLLYSFSRLVFLKNLFLCSLDVIQSKYGWAKLTFWYFVTEVHFNILPPEITSEIVPKTGKCIGKVVAQKTEEKWSVGSYDETKWN